MDASWLVRGGECVPGPIGGSARVLVAGDTHGNLDWLGTLCKLAARHGCQGVVQLGDFGFWPDERILRSEGRAVINDRWLDAVAGTAARHNVWIRALDGNHDFHPAARSSYSADTHGVRPVRSGVLDWADRGSVWAWCGIRFGALGGGISIDRAWRHDGFSYWSTESISDADVGALVDRAGGSGVDVLLTHDAPHRPPGIGELADPVLAAECQRSNDQVVRAVDSVHPKLLLHGHFHVATRSLVSRRWGDYRLVGLSSDEEARDGYGGSWCVLELPTLRILDRADL